MCALEDGEVEVDGGFIVLDVEESVTDFLKEVGVVAGFDVFEVAEVDLWMLIQTMETGREV